ncbi:exo-alpha-sialidase [Adhaeretor mobilis]|uniref:exo-alpha-sialidase n=1 Tax=Adhaeretor mobilis TaxID=1930276 RepID=A0A517MVE7_9BACT|nr:exo-alpha-sialidase [Adhaeretor mobilis]QDS98863.1 Sialidase precursor [Adhaeretor mobilis]
MPEAFTRSRLITPLLIVAAFATCPLRCSHAAITKTTVYTSGTEGYFRYRIPTIVKAANGDLLAFAEARAGGDASDIDIVVKRSVNSGATWGALQVVMDNSDFTSYLPPGAQNITVGNQSPVVDLLDPVNPGRIWMPFTLENDQVFTTYSDDNGATWATATSITSSVKDSGWGWYATGPVHGIQLERGPDAGRLIVPGDHRGDGVDTRGTQVLYSDDHGATWQLGAVATYDNATSIVAPNENVAVELVDGRVYFNARDGHVPSLGNRSYNYSEDGGLTYIGKHLKEDRISTPGVQNSAMRFRATDQGDSENIILYSSPGDFDNRVDLTIHTSHSETLTWTQETLVHSGPSAYSDLVKINQNEFGVLFEAGASLYDEILFAYMDYTDLATPDWSTIQGDVNQDGVLDTADLPYFVSVWTPVTDVVYDGNYESYTNGDLNFDGKNDLADVFLMREAFIDAGLSLVGLNALFQVPEPSSAVLVTIAGLAPVFQRYRRRRPGMNGRER